jgi:hypothetical protein
LRRSLSAPLPCPSRHCPPATDAFTANAFASTTCASSPCDSREALRCRAGSAGVSLVQQEPEVAVVPMAAAAACHGGVSGSCVADGGDGEGGGSSTGNGNLQWPPCPLQRALLQAAGPCVRVAPHVAALVQRMQRVYFLNEAHDLSR